MRVAILLLAWVLLAHGGEPPAGRWEGSANLPGQELKFVLDLEASDSGWNGSLSIPDLGLKGAALAAIEVHGADITFTTKTALADQRNGPAKFKAHLSTDGKMAGDFMQGGNTAPFTLMKTGPAQIEAPRRSTSISKDAEGEWKGGYELFGYPRTVTLKLQNRGTDGATADFVIVGKKENILPVDLVTQEGTFLSVDSHATGLSFEGQLENKQLKGTVIQGPLEIPVTLQREK